ncbi:6-hydroxymethylpterin diphosphokinase MptE-like protein [Lysinibacillus sphaericus]|uniref:6-hydroxymethylpterin diphosphokinase MptE-like protein n=1 Tax=Lysinibacillus sphaericus TaxID=1421 RepID=UPI001910BE16|nr:6-hydroxymethylpterin diphosphokinase MptE-like protein [Lysinibacillus sphaericus]QPA55063.1 DUF115 domain-containing protein [Lysinibacillus sphaericus]
MSKIQVEVLESKKGVPALQVEVDDKKIMLHSKYNPVQEAERFIDSLREKIEGAEHILFYGIGLGYHVKYFSEAYPEKLISTYEPIEQIAAISLKEFAVTDFPKDKLSNYIVEDSQHPLDQNLELLSELLHQKMLLIVLPVYERIFSEQTKKFRETLKFFLKNKGSNMVAASLFSKRWTINALMNLPETFKHENIIIHKKKFFKNKPVILVSAGPSLDEELGNLRTIKERGLAYIFAVGSAAKALVQNNIYPDAMCTYDPQSHNHSVFKEIYEQRITDIPMIYGTTVGFETLQFYQGPKLYFVTSQDQITPQFHKEKIPVISDAPTIALIMLQIFHALEVKKVYLVGQNLAFKKNRYYSKEVKRYDYEKNEFTNSSIQNQDLINSFEVEDVHGGKVMTNDSLNRMRLDIEMYIDFANMDVINTTNSGVAIKGANYQPLKQVIEKELTEKVVVDGWWKSLIPAGLNELNQAFKKKYEKEFDCFIQSDKELENYLDDCKQSLLSVEENQIKHKFEYLDKLFQQYQRNVFFQTTISPITKLAFEKLNAEKEIMSKIVSYKEKFKRAIEVFGTYFTNCRAIYWDIAPIISKLIFCKIEGQQEKKIYGCISGIFHYIGNWEKKHHMIEKDTKSNINISNSEVITRDENAQIAFRFTGTTLKIFGLVYSTKPSNIQVIIDNKVNIITVNSNYRNNKYEFFANKNLFEVNNLDDKMHEVLITILSDKLTFVFEGIEIGYKSRAYHMNEVITVDELQIGKKIRCHYEADYDIVGEFTRLGEESSIFIPIEASPYPNGDFYFIMVDYINGKKKLIADRNVQSNISWESLQKNNKGLVGIYATKINLLNGGFSCNSDNLISNDWDKYVLNSNEDFNIGIISSWCSNNNFSSMKERYKYITIRGNFYFLDEKVNVPSYYGVTPSINKASHIGFRPMLLIE